MASGGSLPNNGGSIYFANLPPNAGLKPFTMSYMKKFTSFFWPNCLFLWISSLFLKASADMKSKLMKLSTNEWKSYHLRWSLKSLKKIGLQYSIKMQEYFAILVRKLFWKSIQVEFYYCFFSGRTRRRKGRCSAWSGLDKRTILQVGHKNQC